MFWTQRYLLALHGIVPLCVWECVLSAGEVTGTAAAASSRCRLAKMSSLSHSASGIKAVTTGAAASATDLGSCPVGMVRWSQHHTIIALVLFFHYPGAGPRCWAAHVNPQLLQGFRDTPTAVGGDCGHSVWPQSSHGIKGKVTSQIHSLTQFCKPFSLWCIAIMPGLPRGRTASDHSRAPLLPADERRMN